MAVAVEAACDADQGRLVAGGHDDHALGQPFGPQVALDELVDLAAALADQGDHDHVGGRVAGHHAQQHALAHAGAGEDAHPLALAAGQQAVDRAHAGGQRLVDPRPRAGVRRAAMEASPVGQRRLRLAVDRVAVGVDHAAQQLVAHAEPAAWCATSRTRLPRRTPRQVAQRDRAASGRRGSRSPRPAAARPPRAGSRPARRPARETRPPRRSCPPSAPRCPSSAVGMMASSCSSHVSEA